MKSRYVSVYNSKNFFLKILFLTGVVGIFIAFVVVLTATFMGTQELSVNYVFYFLVLPAEEETVDVFSEDTYINGGAGYALTYKGKLYVALAAYPTLSAAQTVRDTLKIKGKESEILPLEVTTFYFKGKNRQEEKVIVEGCIDTLLQCITLLYNTANGVDRTQYTQNEARAIINELKSVMEGLQKNALPQFETLLSTAITKCREIKSGLIYAKDIRYLQLFLSEGIYNLQNTFDN